MREFVIGVSNEDSINGSVREIWFVRLNVGNTNVVLMPDHLPDPQECQWKSFNIQRQNRTMGAG